MVCNFESLFDRNTIIKHFDIRPGVYGLNDFIILIKSQSYTDIQNKLISWIHNENSIGQLFKSENWKPFRNQELLTSMYLGYKKLFQYNQYYFQLILEPDCGECEYCKYTKNSIHFELVLYGWKDDNTMRLQPDNRAIILSDTIMPEYYWKRK
jgi:hypothetical protein